MKLLHLYTIYIYILKQNWLMVDRQKLKLQLFYVSKSFIVYFVDLQCFDAVTVLPLIRRLNNVHKKYVIE